MTAPAGPDAEQIRLCAALNSFALEGAAAALRRIERCWNKLPNEEDIEAVHRMRTGANRLRSLLKLIGPVCGWPQVRESETALQRWQKSWGPVRDLDVLILHLSGWAETMDPPARKTADQVLGVYRRRRASLYAKALKETGKKKGKQARAVLDQIQRWVRRARRDLAGKKGAPSAGKINPDDQARSIVLLWPGVIKLWQARKAKAEKNFHGVVLHKFRLANKRLRHVLQLFKPVARPEWLALLSVVDDLHETIGVLHDIEVLIDETETLAARWAKSVAPRNGLKPREIQALLALLDVRRRQAFGHVLELWRELNRPAIKAVLADPLNPKPPETKSPGAGTSAKSVVRKPVAAKTKKSASAGKVSPGAGKTPKAAGKAPKVADGKARKGAGKGSKDGGRASSARSAGRKA